MLLDVLGGAEMEPSDRCLGANLINNLHNKSGYELNPWQWEVEKSEEVFE